MRKKRELPHVARFTSKLVSFPPNRSNTTSLLDCIHLLSAALPFLALIQFASHNKPAGFPPSADVDALVLVLFKGCVCVCRRNAAAGLPQRGWRDQRSPDDPQHGHQLPQPVAQPRLTHTQQLRSVHSTCVCVCVRFCLFTVCPLGFLYLI